MTDNEDLTGDDWKGPSLLVTHNADGSITHRPADWFIEEVGEEQAARLMDEMRITRDSTQLDIDTWPERRTD